MRLQRSGLGSPPALGRPPAGDRRPRQDPDRGRAPGPGAAGGTFSPDPQRPVSLAEEPHSGARTGRRAVRSRRGRAAVRRTTAPGHGPALAALRAEDRAGPRQGCRGRRTAAREASKCADEPMTTCAASGGTLLAPSTSAFTTSSPPRTSYPLAFAPTWKTAPCQDAPVARVLQLLHQAGRGDQRLRQDAAPAQADPAQRLPLHLRRHPSELGQPDGGRVAAGAAPMTTASRPRATVRSPPAGSRGAASPGGW
jgi:hypothetical protein